MSDERPLSKHSTLDDIPLDEKTWPEIKLGINESIVSEGDIDKALEDFDLEESTKSGRKRLAGVTFYRNNVILCAEDREGDNMEWVIIPTDQPNHEITDNQKRIMSAVSDLMYSHSADKASLQILEDMLSDWKKISTRMHSNLTDCYW